MPTRTKLVPVEYHSDSSFRFGNGATEESNRAVCIPVGVGCKVGTIDAAIISGRVPLLLGRPTLEKMNMVLDFGGRKMRFLDQDAPIPTHTNSAGQLLIDVLDFPVSKAGASSKGSGPGDRKLSFVQVFISESAPIPSVQPQDQRDPVEISSPNIPDPKIRPDDVPTPVPGITKPPKSKITLKKKECRCLLSQWTRHANDQDAQIAVAELFSEPRLSKEARRHGASGVAFDIKQDCDLTDPQTQKEVDELLDQARPKSLTASPPCTYWGGWDHLNKCHRTPVERARLIQIARRQVKFSVEQIHKQLRRGGDFLLEHPIGSSIWREPAVRELKRKHGFHRVDICA